MQKKDHRRQVTVVTRIALLTRKERDWLLGKLDLSKSYEYKLKSSIKRKIQTFVNLELPLLIKKNFIISHDPESLGTGFGNGNYYDNSSLGKAKVLGSSGSSSGAPPPVLVTCTVDCSVGFLSSFTELFCDCRVDSSISSYFTLFLLFFLCTVQSHHSQSSYHIIQNKFQGHTIIHQLIKFKFLSIPAQMVIRRLLLKAEIVMFKAFTHKTLNGLSNYIKFVCK